MGMNVASNDVMEWKMKFPVFITPAGLHALVDPSGRGELDSVLAATRCGIPFGMSQHSSHTMERIANEAWKEATKNDKQSNQRTPILWYQFYLLKNRTIARHLLQRAKEVGCQAIVWTVDSVRLGYREADARNGFDALPSGIRLVNYEMYKNNKNENDNDDRNNNTNLEETYNSQKEKSWDQNVDQMFEQDLSWNDAKWIKEDFCQDIPLIIKGIMTPEDAILAVEAGADAIMVSNHGGRQLDGCLATIDALPAVVQAVRGLRSKYHGLPIPVLLDGGIRRGTDILKALALGASAVGIGKPVFFALGASSGSDGATAVQNMLQLLQKELEAAMALTGCQSISDINPSVVMRHPSGNGRPIPFMRSSL